MHRILITGGAGFIGSHLTDYLLSETSLLEVTLLVVLDKLTYAGSPSNLEAACKDPRYHFVQGDICDATVFLNLLKEYRIDTVYHLAAETHVDRSIECTAAFVRTNVLGTVSVLDQALQYCRESSFHGSEFRFIHVSTDEVYGSLEEKAPPFSTTSAWAPNSPYAASKTSSDAFVRAWHNTWGLPTIIVNTSNNYGSRQFPEKLIPLTIWKGLHNEPIPIYDDGLQRRDWLHVSDHVVGLAILRSEGVPGLTYLFGSGHEMSNIELIHHVLDEMDNSQFKSNTYLRPKIIHVTDRPGHDRRYAIDLKETFARISWRPRKTLKAGLSETVDWYLQNQEWTERMLKRAHYRGERLGLPQD